MEVEYVLLPEDLVAFNKFHLKRQPVSWRPLILFMAFYGVGFTLMAVGYGGITRDVVTGGAVMLVIGLGIFLHIKTGHQSTLGRISSEANRGAYAGSLGWRRLALSQAGINVETEASTVKVRWSGVWEVVATRDHAFFYTGRDTAFIVPEAAFRRAAHFQRFVQTAREYAARSKSGARTEPARSEGNPPTTDISPAGPPPD